MLLSFLVQRIFFKSMTLFLPHSVDVQLIRVWITTSLPLSETYSHTSMADQFYLKHDIEVQPSMRFLAKINHMKVLRLVH